MYNIYIYIYNSYLFKSLFATYGMCFIFQCMYFCDSIMVVMSANAREQKKKSKDYSKI